MKKIILYYTCNTHRDDIEQACRRQLLKAGLPIVSVSLNQHIEFGAWRCTFTGKPSAETLHAQIYTGLEFIVDNQLGDVVFFCENDVLYHPGHFEFTPERMDVFYYNEYTYKTDFFNGQSVFYYTKQTSGLCAHAGLLLRHYTRRMERIQAYGKFDRKIGFEPGCHQLPRGVDNHLAVRWMSEFPNLDIRHDRNATRSKWSLEDFRDKRTAEGWTLTDIVPYWGVTRARVPQILESIS